MSEEEHECYKIPTEKIHELRERWSKPDPDVDIAKVIKVIQATLDSLHILAYRLEVHYNEIIEEPNRGVIRHEDKMERAITQDYWDDK